MKIIIYVIDCLRADHVSCYGYDRPITPNIDNLAEDGITFEKAFSPSTWTKPVAASLLTGIYPPAHEVRLRTDVMKFNITSLPEFLVNYGYTSRAVSTIGNVSSSIGFGKGFDSFIDLYKQPSLLDKRSTANVKSEKLYHEKCEKVVYPLAEDINNAVFPWLEDNLDTDFFAFLWALDPHDPYTPPDDWRLYVDPEYSGRMDGTRELTKKAQRTEDLQHLINLYDGEVAYTDSCFGDLIRYLKKSGIYDETAIFVLSDHGEAFGDHENKLHGHLPFEEIIHIPLIIKLPNQEYAGTKVSNLVSIVDIMPTILDLAGIQREVWEPITQGFSLLDGLKGNNGSRMIFSETQATQATNPIYSIRTNDWKYIWVRSLKKLSFFQSGLRILMNPTTLRQIFRNPYFYLKRHVNIAREHLYNLNDDPRESNNLVSELASKASYFQKTIEDWLQDCGELCANYEKLAQKSNFDQATVEQLRSLGYLD